MRQETLRVLHLAPNRAEPSGLGAYAEELRRAAEDHPHLELSRGELPGLDRLPLRGEGLAGRVRDLVVGWEREGSLGPFDVVHLEIGGGSYREFYIGGELTRRRLGPPRVITLHDPPYTVGRTYLERWRGSGWSARISRRAWEFTVGMSEERSLLERAGRVLTLSAGGARALGRRFPRLRVPVQVVEHISFTHQGPAAATNPQEEVCLLWLGFWVRGTGLEDLIEALAVLRETGGSIVPPWRLRVAGGPPVGGNGASSPLEELVRRRGLGDRIEFLGRVPEEELAALFSESQVLVLPRRRMGFLRWELRSVSGSMLRAMASGLAVVATDARAAAEELQSGERGILVDAGNSGRLAEALRVVISDRQLRARLGQAAQDHVRRCHSPEKVIAEHYDVYRAVARGQTQQTGMRLRSTGRG